MMNKIYFTMFKDYLFNINFKILIRKKKLYNFLFFYILLKYNDIKKN
jgi:hypothetical protein